MSLKHYGVLKGRVRGGRGERNLDAPHYQVLVEADGTHYRLAVNVRSKYQPHDLLYLLINDFRHPITAGLIALPHGFHDLPSQPAGNALDFIRGNPFDRLQLRAVPSTGPGADDDLNDRLDLQVRRAQADPTAEIYAFGTHWGPERGEPDKIFGFEPGNGVHNIHMNQGNPDLPPGQKDFFEENGVWQDGALLIFYAQEQRWVAIFLAFQSQAWHTDDQTGKPLIEGEPDHRVRIVGALVSPIGPAPEHEKVTILNASPQVIDLTDWSIANTQKQRSPVGGSLEPGATLTVDVTQTAPLGNSGGIVTLLDHEGLKVDGVAYTKSQAKREGWTIVF
ncbi:MAG: hypothetical protein QOJ59_5533 [Thermomicrobiales bacterium]|jgi:uncharacterized protein YukJ|nr:hypothetical protein [Thermomicrobiales bacterium]